jgi:hypothetical protein
MYYNLLLSKREQEFCKTNKKYYNLKKKIMTIEKKKKKKGKIDSFIDNMEVQTLNNTNDSIFTDNYDNQEEDFEDDNGGESFELFTQYDG